MSAHRRGVLVRAVDDHVCAQAPDQVLVRDQRAARSIQIPSTNASVSWPKASKAPSSVPSSPGSYAREELPQRLRSNLPAEGYAPVRLPSACAAIRFSRASPAGSPALSRRNT